MYSKGLSCQEKRETLGDSFICYREVSETKGEMRRWTMEELVELLSTNPGLQAHLAGVLQHGVAEKMEEAQAYSEQNKTEKNPEVEDIAKPEEVSKEENVEVSTILPRAVPLPPTLSEDKLAGRQCREDIVSGKILKGLEGKELKGKDIKNTDIEVPGMQQGIMEEQGTQLDGGEIKGLQECQGLFCFS